MQPLQHITVLDFSRLIPGPFVTRILADLGARVIKVEDPKRRDYMDVFPPFLFEGESALGVALNHGKERVLVDFESKEGVAFLTKLTTKSDLLIESFRPRMMKMFGLDFASLKRRNPKLLYVSLTGFSAQSAQQHQAGHDLNFLAESGFLNLLPCAGLLPSLPMADFVGGGLFGVIQILSRLCMRRRVAEHLKLSMSDAMAYLVPFGESLQRGGDLLNGELARYRAYRSSDNVVITLAALEDKFWQRFVSLIGKNEWSDVGYDPILNHDIIARLEDIFASKSAAEWRNFARIHDVCMTVMPADDVETGKTISVRYLNQIKSVQGSNYFGKAVRSRYGARGCDNRRILMECGYAAAAIKRIHKNGVIGGSP